MKKRIILYMIVMPESIRKLGRYELLRRIAEGGMGEIYLARQRGAGGFEKTLIIKTILPHLANSEEFVEKFLDEGRIVVQLVHGNIVPVFDMGREDNEYFIAMEYIAGRDLREIQKRLNQESKVLPVDLSLYIVSEFCKGLDYAHRKNDEDGNSLEIVHRDVSPSNILISKEGEVKLIDFGIARATSRLGKTVTGRIQGKFCYMSPEQASGKPLDARSDLFSAGVVLYELLTGHRPFEGSSDLESLDLVRQCEYDPPSTLNHRVNASIDEIVSKVLSKERQDRYSSVDEFQGALLQELYTNQRGPSSKDLESFLKSIFPEGLEHNELRSARDSRPSMGNGKPMSLDEALEMQLNDGAFGKAKIDPFHTTAVQSQTPQTALSPPLIESSSVGIDSSQLSTADQQLPQSGQKRFIAIGLLLGVILTVVGLIYLAQSGESFAESLIESAPPGAEVAVDGATIPNSKTPFRTSLEIGQREITLSLPGFESRKFILNVSEDGENLLSRQVAELRRPQNYTPKSVSIFVTPKDAKLFMDNSELGVGKATVLVKRDGLVKVSAKKEGCGSRIEMIGYKDPRTEIHIKLECNSTENPENPENPDKSTSLDEKDPKIKSDEKMITFRSKPPAWLFFNGKKIGLTPVRLMVSKSKNNNIEFRKQGFENFKLVKRGRLMRKIVTAKLKAKEKGCLNFSVGFPIVAKIAIDGVWLSGNSGRIRNHALSVGPHSIRVKNDTAQKDEYFKVMIKPGNKCTSRHVWPRKARN